MLCKAVPSNVCRVVYLQCSNFDVETLRALPFLDTQISFKSYLSTVQCIGGKNVSRSQQDQALGHLCQFDMCAITTSTNLLTRKA